MVSGSLVRRDQNQITEKYKVACDVTHKRSLTFNAIMEEHWTKGAQLIWEGLVHHYTSWHRWESTDKSTPYWIVKLQSKSRFLVSGLLHFDAVLQEYNNPSHIAYFYRKKIKRLSCISWTNYKWEGGLRKHKVYYIAVTGKPVTAMDKYAIAQKEWWPHINNGWKIWKINFENALFTANRRCNRYKMINRYCYELFIAMLFKN